MALQLHVVPGGESPLYRQIVRQVVESIAGGRARPGERLPSQRELAEQLAISPLTVKKAYDELERLGYAKALAGKGTFVSRTPPLLSEEEKLRRLRGRARRLVSEAHLTGVPFMTLLRLLRQERHSLQRAREEVRDARGRA